MATPTPKFSVPPGKAAQVRIIDTTSRIKGLAVSIMMEPPMENFTELPIVPCWAFLVESSTGQKAVFDLGIPKDVEAMAPVVVKSLKSYGWDVTVQKDVVDILEQEGISPGEVGSVIWSHWHWDHIGDPSRFPSGTELVVGPGFQAAFLPAYPEGESSPIRASDFKGRVLRELDYENDKGVVATGEFRALDFFGDGSFYIMETPGHAIGHLSGLARTSTNPDTFIFMGGDLCHHGGELRPSKYLPLPETVSFHSPSMQMPCPGSLFEHLLMDRGRALDQPFFNLVMAGDIPVAMESVRKAQEADGLGNIWVVYAHDPSLLGVVDLFPKPANTWKELGWREKTLWAFLTDLEPALKHK